MYLTNFCCLVSGICHGSLVNWSNFVLIVSDFHSPFLLGSIFVGDDSDDRQQGSLKVSRMPKKASDSPSFPSFLLNVEVVIVIRIIKRIVG